MAEFVELTHAEWLKINEILLNLYDSTDVTSLRRTYLSQIRELVPYEKGWFDLGDNKKGGHVFFDPISLDMTEESLNDYYHRYESLDYAVWALSQDEPLTYRDTDLVPDALRRKSLFCSEWLAPMGMFYLGGSNIVQGGTLFGSVTFMRSEEAGDFSDRDIQVFDILNGHLCKKFRQMFPNGINYRALTLPKDDALMKYRLTQREYEILQLIGEGLRNHEISQKLFISENTTKKHIAHIFEKMTVNSRSQLLKLIFDK